MNVTLVDLNTHHDPLRKELLTATGRVWNQNNFILGREVNELEEQVAAYSRKFVCLKRSTSRNESGPRSIIRSRSINKSAFRL